MTLSSKKITAIEWGQYCAALSLVFLAISPPLANLFIGLTFLFAISAKESRKNIFIFLNSRIGYIYLAFIGILVSGIFYGIESEITIASAIWGWRKILMLPICAALFKNSPLGKQRLIDVFLWACIGYALISYLTLLVPSLSKMQVTPGVIMRTYVTQGLYFSVATLIAISNLLTQKITFNQKLILFLSIPLFISNIAFFSIGRSGYVGLLVMISVFILAYPSGISLFKKMGLSLIAASLIVATLMASPAARDRVALAKHEFEISQVKAEETSIGLRMTFWKNTIQMLPQYWLLGTGPGGFEKAYASQVKDKVGAEAIVTGDPHNQFLKILVEQGILGLLTFTALLISILLEQSQPPYKTIAMAALLAFAATSMTNSHFSTFAEGQFIWILLGCLIAKGNLLEPKNGTLT